eukprot:944491-Pyramimonas_sp.AAC.1
MPVGVAADWHGNAIVTDLYNHRLRKVTPAGVCSTLAGASIVGLVGVDGASAQLNEPRGYTRHTIR